MIELPRRPRFLGIDTRHPRWLWQRLTRGFDDRDTWSLDHTIAEFILPRLKRFREITSGYPSDMKDFEAWTAALDQMIAAFEYMNSDEIWFVLPDEHQKGMDLFHEYFHSLWT